MRGARLLPPLEHLGQEAVDGLFVVLISYNIQKEKNLNLPNKGVPLKIVVFVAFRIHGVLKSVVYHNWT